MSVTTQSCKSQDHPKLDLHLKNQSEWILIEFSFLQTVFCRFSKAGENFHRKSFIPKNCPHPLLLRGKLKDDIIPFLCPENEKKFLIQFLDEQRMDFLCPLSKKAKEKSRRSQKWGSVCFY